MSSLTPAGNKTVGEEGAEQMKEVGERSCIRAFITRGLCGTPGLCLDFSPLIRPLSTVHESADAWLMRAEEVADLGQAVARVGLYAQAAPVLAIPALPGMRYGRHLAHGASRQIAPRVTTA